MLLKDLTLNTPQENILYDDVLLHLAEQGQGGEILRFWESPEYFVVLGKISKEQEDIKKLNTSLRELSILYDDVEVIYHESNILKGKVSMSEEQLKAISAKINDIRNEVVG